REFCSASDVSSLMTQEPRFEAIHLFKGGTLLLDSRVPFGVVFGGTDVNEDVKDEHKRAVMEEVLRRKFAVAFTDKLKERAEVLLVFIAKINQICQGCLNVTLLSCVLGVCTKKVENLCVFLLVCGLRRVKDPLYLLEAFAEWHSQNPLVVLIIIGPKFMHEDVCVCRTFGVYLAADLSQEELHAAMLCVCVYKHQINFLKIDNVMDNRQNLEASTIFSIFLFLQEFVNLSRKLLDDRRLQKRLVRNGKNYITACQNPMKERITYQKLVETFH
uniref:Glycosyltransferase 1 domain containing 1 n=1 Tax=Cyprinus carpio carpio TaxID=630221 RepID=A0A9J8AUK1_CYPCA